MAAACLCHRPTRTTLMKPCPQLTEILLRVYSLGLQFSCVPRGAGTSPAGGTTRLWVRRPCCVLLGGRLAEIYLCDVCSCQEILRRNGRGQPTRTAACGPGATASRGSSAMGSGRSHARGRARSRCRLGRCGCILPANAGGFDTHRDAITCRSRCRSARRAAASSRCRWTSSSGRCGVNTDPSFSPLARPATAYGTARTAADTNRLDHGCLLGHSHGAVRTDWITIRFGDTMSRHDAESQSAASVVSLMSFVWIRCARALGTRSR
jgi:hypothetical protein